MLLMRVNQWQVDQKSIIYSLILILVGAIGSLIAISDSQILMLTAFALNTLNVSLGLRIFTAPKTLKYLTFLCFLFIAGGIFASIYVSLGGGPVMQLDLPDRVSYFFFTTFTNAYAGSSVRAAGIFDEPGALALFFTIAVALNEAFSVNKKWSLYILILGLTTGSVALFTILIVYLLYNIHAKNAKLMISGIILASGLMLIPTIYDSVQDNFAHRFEVVDGRLEGDNRTHQIENFFDDVTIDITLRGEKASTKVYQEADRSSNPFSIYFRYGLVAWLPFLFLELWLLYASFAYMRILRFPAMAMFLVLLQRPYIYNLYWSMMIMLIVVSIYRLQQGGRSGGQSSEKPRLRY